MKLVLPLFFCSCRYLLGGLPCPHHIKYRQCGNIYSTLLKPYRVLVVDDLEHERIAIKTAISAAVPECEFVEAADVPAAQNVLKEEVLPFDLAVIDLSSTFAIF